MSDNLDRLIREASAEAERLLADSGLRVALAEASAKIEQQALTIAELREILVEVARLWPTIPADMNIEAHEAVRLLERCRALSASVATVLYQLSNPVGENDVGAGQCAPRGPKEADQVPQHAKELPDSRDGGERPAPNSDVHAEDTAK